MDDLPSHRRLTPGVSLGEESTLKTFVSYDGGREFAKGCRVFATDDNVDIVAYVRPHRIPRQAIGKLLCLPDDYQLVLEDRDKPVVTMGSFRRTWSIRPIEIRTLPDYRHAAIEAAQSCFTDRITGIHIDRVIGGTYAEKIADEGVVVEMIASGSQDTFQGSGSFPIQRFIRVDLDRDGKPLWIYAASESGNLGEVLNFTYNMGTGRWDEVAPALTAAAAALEVLKEFVAARSGDRVFATKPLEHASTRSRRGPNNEFPMVEHSFDVVLGDADGNSVGSLSAVVVVDLAGKPCEMRIHSNLPEWVESGFWLHDDMGWGKSSNDPNYGMSPA